MRILLYQPCPTGRDPDTVRGQDGSSTHCSTELPSLASLLLEGKGYCRGWGVCLPLPSFQENWLD